MPNDRAAARRKTPGSEAFWPQYDRSTSAGVGFRFRGSVLSEWSPRTAMNRFASLSHISPPPGLDHAAWADSPILKVKRRRGPKPSPAKRGRDAARQQLFQCRGTSSPCGKNGLDAVQLFGETVGTMLLDKTGLLGQCFAALRTSRVKCQQRTRDLFPLPALARWPANNSLRKEWELPALTLANHCILSLNVLWSDFKQPRMLGAGAPTVSQIEVQQHVVDKTARMLERFSSAAGDCWHWKSAFQKFEVASQNASEPIGAAVDLPAQAATCDPLRHVDHSLRAIVGEASNVFPEIGASLLSGCDKPNRSAEYLTLVSKEILCGKLRLRLSVKAAAPVFAVGKSTSGRQRKVWNGSEVSAAAAKPPVPPRLANPSSFLDLHVRPQDPISGFQREMPKLSLMC